MRQPQLCDLAQGGGQGGKLAVARFQSPSDCHLVERSPHLLVDVRGFAIRPPISLSSHVSNDPIVLKPHHCPICAHQTEQPRDRLGAFEVVHDAAPARDSLQRDAGALRRAFEERTPLRQDHLEVIGVSRVSDQATRQKGAAENGASAASIL
jgi:hypothetical protein